MEITYYFFIGSLAFVIGYMVGQRKPLPSKEDGEDWVVLGCRRRLMTSEWTTQLKNVESGAQAYITHDTGDMFDPPYDVGQIKKIPTSTK